MNTLLRLASVAVVSGLLALLVFGLRFACNPADWSAIIQRREELGRLEEATLRRFEARQRVVREVIDGRRTLAEAIERFQELDQELERDCPDSKVVPEVAAWGGSRDERSYRHILAWVEGRLRDRPEELSALVRRLEHEYQQRRAGELAPSPATTKRTEPSR